MDTLRESSLVTGVTLVYNQLDFVRDCIDSVKVNTNSSYLDYHIWDNHSSYPGVEEYLKTLDCVEGNGSNVGVGAALNQVIERTTSKYFFKLDDDCILPPMTLPLMILAYSLCEQAGFPLAVLSADVTGIGKAAGPYEEVEVAPGIILECSPCVGGGCVLISREVLDDVGPWRADRLYGVEDGDFAARARNKGYQNAYLRNVYHVSRCRGTDADPVIDAWKLDYAFGRTDKAFEEWK